MCMQCLPSFFYGSSLGKFLLLQIILIDREMTAVIYCVAMCGTTNTYTEKLSFAKVVYITELYS